LYKTLFSHVYTVIAFLLLVSFRRNLIKETYTYGKRPIRKETNDVIVFLVLVSFRMYRSLSSDSGTHLHCHFVSVLGLFSVCIGLFNRIFGTFLRLRGYEFSVLGLFSYW